jgi:PKD repeat protein
MRYLSMVIIFILFGCESSIKEFPNVVAKFDIAKSEGDFYAEEGFVVVNLTENATEISWDFGDGTISSDSIYVHSYKTPGTYTLTLNASNPGNSDMVSMEIMVKDNVLKLLTNNSSKAWYLTNWIDNAGKNVDFDTCYCVYSHIFYTDGKHKWLNSGEQICGQDTFQCWYGQNDYGGYEFSFNPYNRSKTHSYNSMLATSVV